MVPVRRFGLSCCSCSAVCSRVIGGVDVPRVTSRLFETNRRRLPVTKNPRKRKFVEAPKSRQHFDIWQFATADKNGGQQSYFEQCRRKSGRFSQAVQVVGLRSALLGFDAYIVSIMMDMLLRGRGFTPTGCSVPLRCASFLAASKYCKSATRSQSRVRRQV